MLDAVSVGTDDLDASVFFYDGVLCPLSMVRITRSDTEAGYGPRGGKAIFFVNVPYNDEPASFGNGVQISFLAKDRDSVDRFHETAIELGGRDDGGPGERSYSPGYYGAYCRDPYGNKLHACHLPT